MPACATRMRALRIAVVVVICGCNADAADDTDAADGGTTFDTRYEAIGCGAEVPRLELELIPQNVFAFRHVSSKCETQASEFLLKNTSDSEMRLDSMGVPRPFKLAGFEPGKLEPQASISIALTFNASTPMERTGRLAVIGPDGCREFEVRGQSVDDNAITTSAQALDFGAGPGGRLSRLRNAVDARRPNVQR
jgi:hypothetical protein